MPILRRLALPLLAALAAIAPAAAGAASTGAHYQHESYAQLRAQLSGHLVKGATLYRRAHTIHVSARGGRYSAIYPRGAEAGLVAGLKAAHVRFHVRSGGSAGGGGAHGLRLRYVVGIGLLALALVAGTVALVVRRRGRRTPQQS